MSLFDQDSAGTKATTVSTLHLRASDIDGLKWDDVIQQSNGKVQLSNFGKGSKRREMLLPNRVGEQLLA